MTDKYNGEEMASIMHYVADCITFAHEASALPNCNTCAIKKDCQHKPKLGEMVRINCFAWVRKEGKDT